MIKNILVFLCLTVYTLQLVYG